MPKKISLQKRRQKLLKYIQSAGKVDIRLLNPDLHGEIRKLASEGFLKIHGNTVTLTPAGREALKNTPHMKTALVSIKNGAIHRGTGSHAYILKAPPQPHQPKKRAQTNPQKILEKAQTLLLQGKYRYAAATLLPLAQNTEERREILQLTTTPHPKQIAAKIRALRKRLADTQTDKDNSHT